MTKKVTFTFHMDLRMISKGFFNDLAGRSGADFHLKKSPENPNMISRIFFRI